MLGERLDEWSVQTVTTQFNIFKSKEYVESMLIESLNHFKLDLLNTLSTSFQYFFYAFNNVERPVQMPPTFGSTKC